MLINLTGVVQTGQPLAPTVPRNTRREIHIPKGGSLSLVVTVLDPLGMPYDLTDKTALLTVKKNSLMLQVPPGFQKTGQIGTAEKNKTTFSIAPVDTKWLEAGRWVYDVWVTTDSSRDVLIPLSPFVIEPAVTLP